MSPRSGRTLRYMICARVPANEPHPYQRGRRTILQLASGLLTHSRTLALPFSTQYCTLPYSTWHLDLFGRSKNSRTLALPFSTPYCTLPYSTRHLDLFGRCKNSRTLALPFSTPYPTLPYSTRHLDLFGHSHICRSAAAVAYTELSPRQAQLEPLRAVLFDRACPEGLLLVKVSPPPYPGDGTWTAVSFTAQPGFGSALTSAAVVPHPAS
ncbi:hypothetical protein V5799_031259 [Amblyomma americanum]|uniref:Uncharacterized protein n=1 Tax=Amblyomma americanum TaxID=6943 RepID=A0AAQ4EKX0_AMBAM